ncbi:MAG: hypothetical protein H0V63_10325 [Burkholderiaceae bacterium]|nr:hypothetical protein [Burkholderiaceae bacterium]
MAEWAECRARQKALGDAVRNNYTTKPVSLHGGKEYPNVTAAMQIERDRARLLVLYVEAERGYDVAKEINRARIGKL